MSAEANPDTKRRFKAIPTGLVLFRPGTDAAKRRRRQIFLVAYLVAAAMVLWPVFPLFSGIRPLILGLPLSLAWVMLALGVVFVALVWLYQTEERD